MFSLHGKVAFVTLGLLILIGIGMAMPYIGTKNLMPTVIDIGVEHTRPLTLSITLSEGTGRRLIDIQQGAAETIYLSTPQNWMRTEVRHATIEQVTHMNPDATFT